MLLDHLMPSNIALDLFLELVMELDDPEVLLKYALDRFPNIEGIDLDVHECSVCGVLEKHLHLVIIFSLV